MRPWSRDDRPFRLLEQVDRREPHARDRLAELRHRNLSVAPARDRLLEAPFHDGFAACPPADACVADSAPAAAAAAAPRAVRLVIRAIASPFVVHHEREQTVAGADDDVLTTVHLVRDGTVRHTVAETCVPDGIACRGVQRDEILAVAAREEQVAGRGEQARVRVGVPRCVQRTLPVL